MEKIKHALRDSGIEFELRFEEMRQKGQAHREYLNKRLSDRRDSESRRSIYSAAGEHVSRFIHLVAHKLTRR